MAKIKVSLGLTSIYCGEEDCIYKRTCANHVSAGDYRMEDGFTPELQFIKAQAPDNQFFSSHEFYCATKDRNPIYYEYEVLPINHEELGNRCLYCERGILKR